MASTSCPTVFRVISRPAEAPERAEVAARAREPGFWNWKCIFSAAVALNCSCEAPPRAYPVKRQYATLSNMLSCGATRHRSNPGHRTSDAAQLATIDLLLRLLVRRLSHGTMQATFAQLSSPVATGQRRAVPQQHTRAIVAAPKRARRAVAVRAEGEAAGTGIETKGPNMKALKDIQVR